MRPARIWLDYGFDLTDPILDNATGTKTGETTADGTVDVVDDGSANDAAGSLFYYASVNESETLATVLANGTEQAVTGLGEQSVSFTGLTGNTTYYAHYVYQTTQDRYSLVVTSASFTTDAAAGGYPMPLHHHYQVNIGSQ